MTAVDEHKAHAPRSVVCGIVTISDSRTPETDESGPVLRRILEEAGHSIPFYTVVRDEGSAILQALDLAALTCEVILTNGGTGLSSRDVTIETLQLKFDKVLPGFGELFRMMSFGKIGSAAMMSRALAGVYKGRLVFCLPGSPEAVELGARFLILPELAHAVGVMRR